MKLIKISLYFIVFFSIIFNGCICSPVVPQNDPINPAVKKTHKILIGVIDKLNGEFIDNAFVKVIVRHIEKQDESWKLTEINNFEGLTNQGRIAYITSQIEYKDKNDETDFQIYVLKNGYEEYYEERKFIYSDNDLELLVALLNKDAL